MPCCGSHKVHGYHLAAPEEGKLLIDKQRGEEKYYIKDRNIVNRKHSSIHWIQEMNIAGLVFPLGGRGRRTTNTIKYKEKKQQTS